jgi:hypothetical protein
MSAVNSVKVLPWGEEIYLELPIHKGKSLNKFYARHGKTTEGREYIEFSKFGPKPNTEKERYSQKLRLYSPMHWAQLKHYVEHELCSSISWNLAQAQQEFEKERSSQDSAEQSNT